MGDTTLKFRVDQKRYLERVNMKMSTRMQVVAMNRKGIFETHDIFDLDLPSLKNWLRQHGGYNPFAETAVAIMLNHSREEVMALWNKDAEERKKDGIH